MCSATTAPVCLGLARGSKPEFFQKDRGDDEADRNPMFNGRRQPSRGGTSRMMREYQVRFCERLGVKFPGPTRQKPAQAVGAGRWRMSEMPRKPPLLYDGGGRWPWSRA